MRRVSNLNKYIDHTLLKPEAGLEKIETLCSEAMAYEFYSVCVLPYYVSKAKSLLSNSPVKVCTVVGFPLGAHPMEAKITETQSCINSGADEIDMVINIAALKDSDFDRVKNELSEIKTACQGKLLKVILETSSLSNSEKIAACQMATQAGVDFVKTSTGFAGGGATEADVKLMKENVAENIQVKASGGIRDLQTAERMIHAGATRLGTSASLAIMGATHKNSSEAY